MQQIWATSLSTKTPAQRPWSHSCPVLFGTKELGDRAWVWLLMFMVPFGCFEVKLKGNQLLSRVPQLKSIPLHMCHNKAPHKWVFTFDTLTHPQVGTVHYASSRTCASLGWSFIGQPLEYLTSNKQSHMLMHGNVQSYMYTHGISKRMNQPMCPHTGIILYAYIYNIHT